MEKLGGRWDSGSHLAEWQGGDPGSQFSFCKLSIKPPAFSSSQHPCLQWFQEFPVLSLSKVPFQNWFFSHSFLLAFPLRRQLSAVPNPLSMLLPFYMLFSCQNFFSLITSPLLLFLYIGSCILNSFTVRFYTGVEMSASVQSVGFFLLYFIYLFINIPPSWK